jgi:hypothetical protein
MELSSETDAETDDLKSSKSRAARTNHVPGHQRSWLLTPPGIHADPLAVAAGGSQLCHGLTWGSMSVA